jgi:hypothetical protein
MRNPDIASVDADGFPHMKAMLPPRKRGGIRELRFATNTAAARVAQFRNCKTEGLAI